MTRGIKEMDGFTYIRHELFYDDAFRISFSKFNEDRILLSKYQTEHMFAMSNDDIHQVEDLFWKAVPNPRKSEFPDFISDNGFIEHFQITSSEITKAGAEHRKSMSEFEKEHIAKEEGLTKEMNEHPYEIQSIQSVFNYGTHSHENLLSSLKCSLEHHISSSHKYTGNKDCRIYMIEYDELILSMAIDYGEVMTDVFYGDLLRRDKTKEYRISRDKDALRYLYEHKVDIDYIVFITDYNFEIINVSNILEIMKLLPFSYNVYPVQMTEMSFTQGLSIPLCGEKERKENV